MAEGIGNMELYEKRTYQENIKKVAGAQIAWDRLSGKKILIAGATGLIGRYLIDLIMYKNKNDRLGCAVTAASRNKSRAERIFPRRYFEQDGFRYFEHDVREPFGTDIDKLGKFDYVIHLASNTHPVAYAERPIETIAANVYGTKNLLDLCVDMGSVRFIFPSSVEIYGENRGDTELFKEDYVGYLDCNTLRAGYPESKRVCESLCQAYCKEKNVDIVIPRLPRVFGPTMAEDDSKAVAQFIREAVGGEDIILKSTGAQCYSFLYVADAVTGLIVTMLFGMQGEAYNVADQSCDMTLKEMAELCALEGNGNIRYECPDEVEKSGYSTATKARLDGGKIKALGWLPDFSIEEGICQTICILKEHSV